MLFTFLFFIFVSHPSARSYVYQNADIDIEVLENSNMIVTEKFTYRFDGIYRGVFRDISLIDRNNYASCDVDPTLQCGGFDTLNLLEVRDNNGELLDYGEYTTEEYYNTTYYEDRLKVVWMFAPDGKEFANETFDFSIKYEVVGGIGFFENYDLFYWNVLFPDRDTIIENANINIHFPDSLPALNTENFQVITTSGGQDYYQKLLDSDKTINITIQNFAIGEEMTTLVTIPKGMLIEPGSIEIIPKGVLMNWLVDTQYYVDGELKNIYLNKIEKVPVGNVFFEAKRDGYDSFSKNLLIESGQTTKVEVELKPNILTTIMLVLSCGLSLLGLLGIPGSFLLVYLLWYFKGKDKTDKTTIVPEFSPPENLGPYLVGSLKDEKVDLKDITSVIVDTAYRGYIKIVEEKSRVFRFEKLKDFGDLGDSEKYIMEKIFKSKDKVTTSDLANNFYMYLPTIKGKIYSEMKDKKFFNKRPDHVRSSYLWYGIIICITSFCGLGFVSSFFIEITGTPWGIFVFQVAAILFGLLMVPIAFFMPAKTLLGSELNRRFEGFKMFLHHAERFKLQNLTPETFEKYLSYAMVFGVEKQWAKNFESIYEGSPSWYEGSSAFSTMNMVSTLSRMNTLTASSMRSVPQSSSSYSGGSVRSFSGGGFRSSGGGFSGGFSGGGGGGGGGGAF